MANHVIVFLSFYSIALSYHFCKHIAANHVGLAEDRSRPVVMAVAIVAHPVTLDAIKEFVVHIVIYSGAFISAH